MRICRFATTGIGGFEVVGLVSGSVSEPVVSVPAPFLSQFATSSCEKGGERELQ